MYIAYCRKNTERLQTGKLLRFYRSTESELYTVRLTRDSRIWVDSFSSILCWRQSWLGSIMTVPLVFVSNRRSGTAAAGLFWDRQLSRYVWSAVTRSAARGLYASTVIFVIYLADRRLRQFKHTLRRCGGLCYCYCCRWNDDVLWSAIECWLHPGANTRSRCISWSSSAIIHAVLHALSAGVVSRLKQPWEPETAGTWETRRGDEEEGRWPHRQHFHHWPQSAGAKSNFRCGVNLSEQQFAFFSLHKWITFCSVCIRS